LEDDVNVLDDIKRSAPSLGHFNTGTMTGFARRLFRQYGTRAVLDVLQVQISHHWKPDG